MDAKVGSDKDAAVNHPSHTSLDNRDTARPRVLQK